MEWKLVTKVTRFSQRCVKARGGTDNVISKLEKVVGWGMSRSKASNIPYITQNGRCSLDPFTSRGCTFDLEAMCARPRSAKEM